MSIPARTRESFTMAAKALAPPSDWPTMAILDRSIREEPSHFAGS